MESVVVIAEKEMEVFGQQFGKGTEVSIWNNNTVSLSFKWPDGRMISKPVPAYDPKAFIEKVLENNNNHDYDFKLTPNKLGQQ